jgi:cytochrome b561
MTMDTPKTSRRYGSASIAMHWAMVLVFVAVYALINVAEVFEKGSAERQMARDWHFTFGLLVFALVWVRIVLRVLGTTPPIEPATSARMEKLAKLGHLALYVLMIGLPVLGWLALSARGKPIPFFGLNLPALIAPDKALGSQLKELHEFGGSLGYFLIGGHAVAALFHHYVLQDNTLLRMGFKRQS